ncbi:MAG: hypothetical protein FJY37_13095, partial [Betaproteobacteria bacterium]|nr:hypothetical protein [Betaproteobacteria bacterium]
MINPGRYCGVVRPSDWAAASYGVSGDRDGEGTCRARGTWRNATWIGEAVVLSSVDTIVCEFAVNHTPREDCTMASHWHSVGWFFGLVLAFALGSSQAAVTEPVVFVSRQISDQGSVFYTPASALPGVGPHGRFRPSSPGKLMVREVNGSLRVLVDGAAPAAANLHLIDVNAPSVSYDGRRILFSGLPAPVAGRSHPANPGEIVGAWRLYVINADGTGLRQVPIPEQTIPVSYFVPGASGTWRYDDTYPCWLPDGRIVFSSTRWLTFGQYSGMVGSNLFVVNADGSNLHRITSERSGADRPLVDPLTGRIVFARWWRNYRFPTDLLDTVRTTDGYARHLGLTTQFDPVPPANVGQFDANFWAAASINPDGTDLKA